MKKNRTPDSPLPVALELAKSPLAPEKAEKGSHRSMWELLLQLRVLVPYLTHLIPLLERNPMTKASPELLEVTKGIAVIQTGSRELETQVRNQTLQLERIDEKVTRLQGAFEDSLQEGHGFYEEMRRFRRLVVAMLVVIFVLIGSTAGMVTYLLLRP